MVFLSYSQYSNLTACCQTDSYKYRFLMEVFRGSGHEDGLRRATFPSSWKSSQKSRKKPMVSSLPCALCIMRNCRCVPHVRVRLPFSFCYRIVSAPAPLPLTGTEKILLHPPCGAMWASRPTKFYRWLAVGRGALTPPPYSAGSPTVAPHERQRRKMDRRYVIRSEKNHAPQTRGRRWQMRNRNSAGGFLNRRFKLSFWVLLGQRPKVPRAGARKYLYFTPPCSPLRNSKTALRRGT